MPETAPYVASGLCEALDIFFIQQLRTLLQFYTDQQGQSLKIDVKAVWTKGDVSSYPFIGVMTHIPRIEPVAIGDFYAVEATPGSPTVANYFTINEVRIGLSLQAIELRELARLREFLILNFERGFHPVNKLLWRSWFLDHGVDLMRMEPDEPEQVDFRTLQMRTRMAQGEERMDRTDIETLWAQDLALCARVELNVPLISTQGVITGLSYSFHIDEGEL